MSSDDLGLKRLTPHNAYSLDPTSLTFIAQPIGDGVNDVTVSRWNELFLAPQLGPPVPRAIIDMFDVARGMACYGCYYYPLYQQSMEQLFRVLEAAAMTRADELGAPTGGRHRTYDLRLKWLFRNGHIDQDIYKRWQAGRSLRNISSHRRKSGLTTPAQVSTEIDLSAALITSLFTGTSLPESFKPDPRWIEAMRSDPEPG